MTTLPSLFARDNEPLLFFTARLPARFRSLSLHLCVRVSLSLSLSRSLSLSVSVCESLSVSGSLCLFFIFGQFFPTVKCVCVCGGDWKALSVMVSSLDVIRRFNS